MLLGSLIRCKLPLMWELRGGQCAWDLLGTPSPKSIGTLGHWKVEAPGCTSKLLGFVGHRTSWWWGVYGTWLRSGAYLCRIGSFKNVLCCVCVHALHPRCPISLRSRSTACHRKRRSLEIAWTIFPGFSNDRPNPTPTHPNDRPLAPSLSNLNEAQRNLSNLSEPRRTSAKLSEPQQTPANLSKPQRTSANLSEPQRNSANLSETQRTSATFAYLRFCRCQFDSSSFVVSNRFWVRWPWLRAAGLRAPNFWWMLKKDCRFSGRETPDPSCRSGADHRVPLQQPVGANWIT